MADQIVVGVAGVALFVVVGFVTATMMLITERRRRKGLERRLQPVTSLDEEVAKLRGILRDQNKGIEELRSSYRQKLDVYNRLAREVAVFDEKLSFAEMGVYEPHFDYTDSEQYKAKILEVRARQKAMVSAKTAVICRIAWQVDGSAQKGQTMTNRNIRLTLRAFNNECEAAIANTRWNNVNAMEKRIATAREQIDKLNESNKIEVTREYLQLKLEELYLTHEAPREAEGGTRREGGERSPCAGRAEAHTRSGARGGGRGALSAAPTACPGGSFEDGRAPARCV